MSTIIELNPQDFARTQKGSCLMTATDTETGIKEPIALFEGRASGRTAVGRDGYIYDVLPYEPAFTLINGKMVLSEEPLATNYELFSEPTSGGNDVSFEDFNWGNGFTNCIRFLDNSVLRQYSNSNNPVLATYTSSFFIIMDDFSEPIIDSNTNNGDLTVYIGAQPIPMTDIKKTNLENGIWHIEATKEVSSTQYSYIRKSTTQSSKGFRVVGLQIEEGSRATSLIRTNGATATRLGATGVKTPDISKYINSEEGSFTIKTAINSTDLFPNRVCLTDETGQNRIMLDFGNASNSVKIFVFSSGSVILSPNVPVTDITSFNEIRVDYGSTGLFVYVNGDLGYSSTVDVSKPIGTYKYIKQSDYNDTSSLLADVESITLIS